MGIGDWGLGIGDLGIGGLGDLGTGDWEQKSTSYSLLPTSYFLLPTPYFLLPSYEVCLCEAVSFRATGQRHGRDRVPVVEDDDLPLRGCAACDPPSGSAVCSSRGTRPTQLLHRNARTSRIMTTSRYFLLHAAN